MTYVYGAIEGVLLACAVAVAWYVSMGTERRIVTVLLGVVFAVVSFVATGVIGAGLMNYRWPVAWIAAAVAAVAVAAGVVVAYGRNVGWRVRPMLGLVALYVLGGLGIYALVYTSAGDDLILRMSAQRIVQMGDAFGFTPLTPGGEELVTDTVAVEKLPGSEKGIVFHYHGFEMHERKAGDATAEGDLLKLLAPGSRPMVGIDEVVPGDATLTTLTVGGWPAAAAEFTHQPAAKGTSGKVTILVLVRDGVDVRFWCGGREEYADGKWTQYPAYTAAELAGIAEKLEPVR